MLLVALVSFYCSLLHDAGMPCAVLGKLSGTRFIKDFRSAHTYMHLHAQVLFHFVGTYSPQKPICVMCVSAYLNVHIYLSVCPCSAGLLCFIPIGVPSVK